MAAAQAQLLFFLQQFLKSAVILTVMGLFFLALSILLRRDFVLPTGARRQSWRTDVHYFFFSTLIVAPVIYVIIGLFAVQGRSEGATWMRGLPFWLLVLLSTYIVDVTYYWQHRLFHNKYLWPFHAVHHSTEHLTWLSNIRGSPVDSAAHSIAIFAVPYFLGFSTEVVQASGMISYFSAYFVHADIPWRFGFLRHVFVTPAHHRSHHADMLRPGNFSGIFAFNDRLFGTYVPPESVASLPLGLGSEQYPQGFGRQFVRQWRDFYKALRA